MILTDSDPGDPVKHDNDDSALVAAVPKIHHSSSGAACQRLMPPKVLNDSASFATVTEDERCGTVVEEINPVGVWLAENVRACGLAGPFELGVTSAARVTPSVESRAHSIWLTVEAEARPCWKISITKVALLVSEVPFCSAM